MDQFQFIYTFPVDINEANIAQWLNYVSVCEGVGVQCVSIEFLSNEQLRSLNKKHLHHDYFTDVITFDNSFDQGICGDIMISVEMVNENARRFNTTARDELYRVMVHGLLHLLGYSDGTPEEKIEMRAKEDHYLNLRPT